VATTTRYIWDLETDNLLDDVTKVHCAVLVNADTDEVSSFKFSEKDQEQEFLAIYQDPNVHLIGFNSIKFDHAVIQKLYGIPFDQSRCDDAIVLGRLVYPDIKATDFIRARLWKDYLKSTDEGTAWYGDIPREFPGKFVGSHSLKAWGYRLGVHKGDYEGGWEQWSPEMHEYMLQDGTVTLDLYRRLMAHEPSPQALELEYRVAWLCAQIERNGFPFDSQAATELLATMVDEREALRRDLVGLFPNWMVRLPDFIPKRNNATQGYIAGVPVPRWREHEFNPSSRDHIADRLTEKYGWKPESWTDGGKAVVDDEVLSKLPYPEAQKLSRSFLLDKRIGQLAEGNQAWLNVTKNGRIHASYNTNGAVTGRATHSHPNISQVPRVSSPFGRDCRALFTVPPGWVLVGADQSGLELRCLASDMAAFDGGTYCSVVTEGDVHTTNQVAFGFYLRDSSKTGIYAVCYGAGDEKLGTIAEEDARKAEKPKPEGNTRAIGTRIRRSFESGLPAFKQLVRLVKSAAERGWIKGIDGRKMPVRSPHAALNVRLQNSGAVICKQWGCDANDELQRRGLKHGWDGDYAFVSWSHDEYQVAVRDDPATIAIVREVMRDTGRNAGKPFNFNCPLDVETKVGANWAETH
jgi:DNA polymerase I